MIEKSSEIVTIHFFKLRNKSECNLNKQNRAAEEVHLLKTLQFCGRADHKSIFSRTLLKDNKTAMGL